MNDLDLRLESIHVYPVKSCAGTSPAHAVLAETGFDLDREWMVVDASGSFVTQRELPIRSVLIWSRLNFAALE